MRRILFVFLAAGALAQDLPKGRLIESVKCADPSQTYALYLPSNYSADRAWSVILAFDPRARGSAAVERFAAAAETYGYIVAGSNNSRNGPWAPSLAAAEAMTADVSSRFHIDPSRIYMAGMSGGARVAMQVALGSNKVAGVIAASAGFPAGQSRKTVPFAVFGTAGTEDFNYIEMRGLDRDLASPHRVVIFEGGHGWMPVALATEAVEWMETRAGKSVDKIFLKRVAAAGNSCEALQGVIADFQGVRDLAEVNGRFAQQHCDKAVKDAQRAARSADAKEMSTLREIAELEDSLGDAGQHPISLAHLRERLEKLARQATAAEDSEPRRMARRVLRGVLAESNARAADPDYRKLLDSIRATLPAGR